MNELRLFLTSGGIKNSQMQRAFEELAGKPISQLRVCYVPTAAYGERDNDWAVDAVLEARSLGWKHFELADLLATPREIFIQILTGADVLFVDCGNVYHLARAFAQSGLTHEIELFLRTKPYIGVSAGSMVFSSNLTAGTAPIFGEDPGIEPVQPPFPWFEWYVKPHYLSRSIQPRRDKQWADAIAAKTSFPVYFIGDEAAIQVKNGTVAVLGAGEQYVTNNSVPQ